MEEIKLNVHLRDKIGSRKIKSLRAEKLVPAIVYGGQRKPTAIQLDRREYERIMRHHQGQNVVFHLNVMEADKKLRDYSAIVKEEQREPVSDSLLHIDFNRISLTQEIEVKVSIAAKGEAVGVKKDGGSIDQPLWELDVVCLPTNIPEKIEIDITEMVIGDAVHVKDIKLPEGVITKHDPESVVLSCVPPMKEEVPTEEEELTEPEIVGEKKEGEEGAEEEKAEEPKAEAKGDSKEEPKKDEKAE